MITKTEIEVLALEEKLRLMELLWDSLSASPKDIPIPDWHMDTIKKRLAIEDASVESWDTVKKRIER